MTTPLAWTASNGSAIEIKAVIGMYGPMIVSTINGNVSGETSNPEPLKTPVKSGDVVVVAAIGKVGLTAERFAAVQEMYEAIKAEFAKTPEGLTQARQWLAEDLAAIREQVDLTSRRRIARASATGIASPASIKLAEQEQAAVDALAAFDAAHPEIIASIQAERAERTERNMWM